MALNVFRLLIASGVAMLMLLPPVGRAREQVPAAAAEARSFGALVASLSEPGGYFDTDNLISNERSYLHVVPTLRTLAGRPAAAASISVSGRIRTSPTSPTCGRRGPF